ncbi:uncharacterized protein [Watersipora subatra]|uniref:uncharacterized protein n=1 Tax=Watersipora subatra TaxID=2589382 RepID=UPI00355AF0A2
MTYVRQHGRPDLFITLTCNPKWTDIKEALLDGQAAHDRHDIVARVFGLKVKLLLNLITKGKNFGDAQCFLYSIEWQKRGLPHCHLLLWLVEKIRPFQVDPIISAEIPDNKENPTLYSIVTKQMIHGPCGNLNRFSLCMKDKNAPNNTREH